MTVCRVLFAAHKRCAIDRAFPDELLNAPTKEWRLRDTVVQNMVMLIVEFFARGTAAQFRSKIGIANLMRFDRVFKVGAVEMRDVA